MSETKTCNLTEDEIEELMMHHARNLSSDTDARLERINYLNRRLKAFKEGPENPPKDDKPEDQPKVDVIAEAQKPVDTSPPTINPEPPKATTSW